MGGCCCCPSKNNDIGTTPFFHFPLPEEPSQSPNRAPVTVLSGGFLVDTNLDTSIPDTYQPPPAPIPYETYGVHPPMSSRNQEVSECKHEVASRPTNTESAVEGINPSNTLETKVKKLGSDDKGDNIIDLEASKDIEDENLDDLKKSNEPFVPLPQDEDDTCPICLEEYDTENPKLITKCDHHFHLACILEWMERSDTCPVCDQEMVLVPVEG